MRQVFSGEAKDWLEVRGKLLCVIFRENLQHLFRPLQRVQLGLECDNGFD